MLAGKAPAATVKDMLPGLPFSDIELGDIVALPDSRSVTSRGKVMLPQPVGSMAGFVVCGELEMLLSVPTSAFASVAVYTPVAELPVDASRCRVAAEGSFRYFAPHLPGLTGAMGELLYRVLEVRGMVDPVVCIWRGNEVIIFVKATVAHPGDFHVLFAPRSEDNDVEVTRYAATVDVPASAPAMQPARVLPERKVRPLTRRAQR
jgi:hypothetical protein